MEWEGTRGSFGGKSKMKQTIVSNVCLSFHSLSQTLGEKGKEGFYEGRIAEAIAQCVQQHGGSMTEEDLKSHQSTFDSPIKTTYRGIDVWEMPPNGQGITALLALNILEGFDFTGTDRFYYYNSAMVRERFYCEY